MEQLKLILEDEVFKDIEDFEGHYQISKYGIVKSLKRKAKCKGNKHRTIKERILKQKLDKYGYLKICLCKNNIKKYCSVSRLVAQMFIPNPENKPEANHKDGIKINNFYKNLEWATRSENELHAYRTGLLKISEKHRLVASLTHRGENHRNAKLKERDVIEIRKLRTTGITYKEIGNMFNVTEQAIYLIIKNKNWKHI